MPSGFIYVEHIFGLFQPDEREVIRVVQSKEFIFGHLSIADTLTVS